MLPAKVKKKKKVINQMRLHKALHMTLKSEETLLIQGIAYIYLLAEEPEGSNILPREIQMVTSDQPICDFI